MNVLEKILGEISIIKTRYESGNHDFIFKKSALCTIVEVESIIRSHMDEVKNDGWIPVEERLPNEKGWYQCTCSDNDIWNKDIVRDLYYYPETKEFVDNIRYENNGLKNIEKYYWTKYVTAWQSLPKPYKPDEN